MIARLRRLAVLVVLLGLPGPPVLAAPPNVQVPGAAVPSTFATFEQRATDILSWFAVNGSTPQDDIYAKYANLLAEARYAAGNAVEGNFIAQSAMDRIRMDPFYFGTVMDMYLRFGKTFWTPAMKDQLKRTIAARSPAKWDAVKLEDQRLLNNVGRYLAAQEWPDVADAIGATDSVTYINAALARLVREGFIEGDSIVYTSLWLTALLQLADLATDPDMRERARLAHDSMLANIAPEWLDSDWVATSYQSYDARWGGSSTAREVTIHGWLYFGGKKPLLYEHLYSGYAGDPKCQPATCIYPSGMWAIPAAISKYRPPAEVLATATDRSTPYVHRETHDVGGYNAHGWRNYRYLRDGYGLASSVTGYDPKLFSNRATEWLLKYRTPLYGNNTFYVRHPVSTDEGSLGSTREFPTMQHEGTLISVLNRGATGQPSRPYITGAIPIGDTIVERDGWIFFQGGESVYVGVFVTGGYTWEAPDIVNSSRYFRSANPRLGLVVETKPTSSYPSLDAFASAVVALPIDASQVTSEMPSLGFTNLDGRRLSMVWGGERALDGVPYDYESWPLFDNPWAFQPRSGRYLTMAAGRTSRVYDWDAWKAAVGQAVANGSLEAGVGTPVDGWEIADKTGDGLTFERASGTAHSGTYSGRVTSASANGGAVCTTGASLVPVVPGQTRTTFGWLRPHATGASAASAAVSVRYLNHAGKPIDAPVVSRPVAANPGWSSRAVTSTAPKQAAYLSACAQLDGTGSVFFDDVSVAEHTWDAAPVK